MTTGDAEKLLIHDTHDADGTYVCLRLGEDPGSQAIERLLGALKLLHREFADRPQLPRAIAFSCGIILQFAAECQWNLDAVGASQDLRDAVTNLQQEAFNVLAGEIADEWT